MTTPLLLFSGRRAFSGALDPYATNIGHVYDISRRWLSSYTGNLVRLRRSTDDAQADFGPAPGSTTGELDKAAVAAWLGADTGYVVTVYDQKQGGNLTQAVAASQPTYVASVRNGHAGMLCAGSHYLYTGGTWLAGTWLTQPYQVFSVQSITSGKENDNNGYYLTDGENDARVMRIFKNDAYTPDAYTLYAGAALLYHSLLGVLWHLVTGYLNGASSVLRVNGSQATNNAGTHELRGLSWGALRGGSQAWWGNPLTILFTKPALTGADQTAVETALNSWWAIY